MFREEWASATVISRRRQCSSSVPNFQCLSIETASAARYMGPLHPPRTASPHGCIQRYARLAPAPATLNENRLGIPAYRFWNLSKQVANGVHHIGVGGRVGTGATNGGLSDGNDFVDLIDSRGDDGTGGVFAIVQGCRRALVSVVSTRLLYHPDRLPP